MTKFDDLCAAYAGARQKFFNYRDECWKFASQLSTELVAFFGCTREQVEFVPVTKERKPGFGYSLMGAMHLAEDTFWHFGILTTIYEAPNIFPQQPLLFHLLVKKVDQSFIVKGSPKGPEFRVGAPTAAELRPLNEWLFEQCKSWLDHGLEMFLEGQEQPEPKKIGF
jgi:hypothetical protein